MKLDILAFGAHPDDVELSCSGLLLVEKSRGQKIGIVDLTEGEMGSRGDAQTRYKESELATSILGADVRINLQMPDCFFENNQDNKLKVIRALRTYRPDVVLCNAPSDRHPDHGRGAQLVAESCFLSGLIKIETSDDHGPQEPWRPAHIFHYIQDRVLEPDFIVDISVHIDKKLESIKAYKTQFHNPDVDGPETYISKPEFLDLVLQANKLLGKRIGCNYGEGYISTKKIGLHSLSDIIKTTT